MKTLTFKALPRPGGTAISTYEVYADGMLAGEIEIVPSRYEAKGVVNPRDCIVKSQQTFVYSAAAAAPTPRNLTRLWIQARSIHRGISEEALWKTSQELDEILVEPNPAPPLLVKAFSSDPASLDLRDTDRDPVEAIDLVELEDKLEALQDKLDRHRLDSEAKDKQIADLEARHRTAMNEHRLTEAKEDREHQRKKEITLMEQLHALELEKVRGDNARQLAQLNAEKDKAVAATTAKEEVVGKTERSKALYALIGALVGAAISGLVGFLKR